VVAPELRLLVDALVVAELGPMVPLEPERQQQVPAALAQPASRQAEAQARPEA
jgi:hypothetical protein